MLDEGYLKRSPDPADGRQALLRITERRRTSPQEGAAAVRENRKRMLDNLTSEERKLLDSLLKTNPARPKLPHSRMSSKFATSERRREAAPPVLSSHRADGGRCIHSVTRL